VIAAERKSADLHPTFELRSFGRRRGRKLSTRQENLLGSLLPRLGLDLVRSAPADLTTLFEAPVNEVWLEIGFGGAEHLIWQARQAPGAGLIGCEPFEEGVVKALSAIEAHGLGNVRLWSDDARPLLRWLPDGALSRVFILFPDPWPKKRHQKRRLCSIDFLRELARVLRPGGELRIATDVGDYARFVLGSAIGTGRFRWMAEGPSDWRQRSTDWPETRYEAKAMREGRRRYFFRFRRI